MPDDSASEIVVIALLGKEEGKPEGWSEGSLDGETVGPVDGWSVGMFFGTAETLGVGVGCPGTIVG